MKGIDAEAAAVIFDMDGVLVDTEPVYGDANRELFNIIGITVAPEEYESFVGISADIMWSGLRSRYGLGQSVQKLISMEQNLVLSRIKELPDLSPIAGIPVLLNALRHMNVPLAVASSSSRALIDLALAKANIRSCFDVVVSGFEIPRGKPAPDIFLTAAGLLGANPGNCVVIEDSANGVTGAKAAGMFCVGFHNPNSGCQDLSRADMVIKDFSQPAVKKITALITETERKSYIEL